jgi:hypothetical protein
MFFHASPIGGIQQLEPRVSNHNIPLIYFSKKRENTLVYLSNAIEKYCKDTGFDYQGTWQKWGSYGFDEDGILRLEEYYPNALEETYKGMSGYIYQADSIIDSGFEVQIPDAATSSEPVTVSGVEYVSDAYETILQAEQDGLIRILRYEDAPDAMKNWLRKVIPEEYKNASDHPEYRYFLDNKMSEYLQ